MYPAITDFCETSDAQATISRLEAEIQALRRETSTARAAMAELVELGTRMAAATASADLVARLVSNAVKDDYAITDASIDLGTLRRFYAAKATLEQATR
jgi:phosphoserine phosphatase